MMAMESTFCLGFVKDTKQQTTENSENGHLASGSSEPNVYLEDVYKLAGGFGKWQRLMYAAMLVIALSSSDLVSISFVSGHRDHWCYIDELQNLSYAQQKYISIPSSGNDGKFLECQMFDLNYTAYEDYDFLNWNRTLSSLNASTRTCGKWVYDDNLYTSTIASRVSCILRSAAGHFVKCYGSVQLTKLKTFLVFCPLIFPKTVLSDSSVSFQTRKTVVFPFLYA